MKNIKERLEKVTADQEELNRALQLVIAERKKLLEESKKIEIFENFDISKTKEVIDYVRNNYGDLLRDNFIKSNKSYFEEFEYDEGLWFSFGDGWTIENHERFGGYEGAGEEHYIIIEVTQGDSNPTYLKVPGYYASYDGPELEWENIRIVKPVVKPVTFWE